MKKLIAAACAACLSLFGMTSGASAQDAGGGKANVQIAHPIGIVTKDTKVVTIADKGIVNKQVAGTKCTLWEGDTVAIVGTFSDGRQIVQRLVKSNLSRVLKMKTFSSESCKINNPVVADSPDVNSWQKKAEAEAAEKNSKRVAPAGKKS